AELTSLLLPVRDEVAAVRVVEIEPAHDRKAVGVFAHRFERQLVRVRVPQHRVDQRPVDARLIHARYRLFRRIRFLTMMRGRRAFLPKMDLCIDDQHLAYPFDPKIFSCRRICWSLSYSCREKCLARALASRVNREGNSNRDWVD